MTTPRQKKPAKNEAGSSRKAKQTQAKTTTKGKSKKLDTDEIQKKGQKKVNCMLPGAELLAEGKTVAEVMQALEAKQESTLNPRQERFCREYVSCGIGTRAYQLAYPNAGYDTARNEAARLLASPCIAERVAVLTEEHNERYNLNESKILKRLAALASFDRRCLYKEDGSLKQIHELTEEEAFAVTEIESRELFAGNGEEKTAMGIVSKVKFADPKGALEMAGKHLKMFTEQKEVKHSGAVTVSFLPEDMGA